MHLLPEKSNASAQPLPEAEAERTLEAVGCSTLFGADSLLGHRVMRVRPTFSPGMHSALPIPSLRV
jgi:hypothetical protein